jgi:transposase
VNTIIQHSVKRGLLWRKRVLARNIGVDETSFRRGHDYVTIVTDLDKSVVRHVAEGRKRENLDPFFESLTPRQIRAIESVAMDIWVPFMASVSQHVPDAESKIVFDKFHVAQHLGDAMDRVRRMEHKALSLQGDTTLKGTRYLWLTRRENLDDQQAADLAQVHSAHFKTSRAWPLKETAMTIWRYVQRGRAEKHWRTWISDLDGRQIEAYAHQEGGAHDLLSPMGNPQYIGP